MALMSPEWCSQTSPATVFQPLCSRMFKVFIDDVLHSKLRLSDCLSEANNGFCGLRLNVFKVWKSEQDFS
jgi:hypothetical protein